MDIIRSYKLSDADMFAYADKVIANLQADLSLFTAFDSTIDMNYVALAQKALSEAKALPSDNVVIDQQVASTEQVALLMQDCRDQYDDMKFFIKKAFKTSLGRQNEFGLNDYDKASINATEMIRFLGDMYNVADRYRSDLTLVGCANSIIDKNKTLENDLNLLVREQNQVIDARSTAAEDRIKVNNTIWDMIILISEAAKRVFRRSPANISRYLRPQPSKTGVGGNTDISVPTNATVKALDGTVNSDSVIEIVNKGTVALTFYVANNSLSPNPITQTLTVNAGDTTVMIAGDFCPDGTSGSLWVCNNSVTTVGKFDAITMSADS